MDAAERIERLTAQNAEWSAASSEALLARNAADERADRLRAILEEVHDRVNEILQARSRPMDLGKRWIAAEGMMKRVAALTCPANREWTDAMADRLLARLARDDALAGLTNEQLVAACVHDPRTDCPIVEEMCNRLWPDWYQEDGAIERQLASIQPEAARASAAVGDQADQQHQHGDHDELDGVSTLGEVFADSHDSSPDPDADHSTGDAP